MSFQINADQQRIEASGAKPTGNWTNATYSRSAAGVGNIVSVAHGIIGTETLYIDFTSGGEVDGNFTVTKVDDDNLSFTGSANSVITAGATLAYKRVRSLSIQGDTSIEMSVGTGALEKDALFINKNAQENVRIGVNTNDPQYELDVEGQIRTTRSIISDTAQVTNLDIDTIINPALNLRAPNLVNFEDTDVTSPTFGTTFFPTADTPPLSDQSRRVATTDFVYKVATNDTGGRVYVSQTIGSDLNDGRSAARPVKTVKKAAQIAYGLQKAVPDPSDEYVTIIVSGGEYLEDNPISLPRNCSLVGDNLRRVILRPQNQDRHMVKASNETYIFGVVFRDALQNASDPQSAVIHTWKYAFVFDDKQRLYYEPEVQQIPAIPGDKYRGDNIFKITFNNHTGDNATLVVGQFVQGGSSGTQGQIQAVNFTGPVASPYSTGDVTVLISSGVNDVFQDAEKVFYDAVLANIITDINNPSVSDRFDVVDAESLRPELETISNQIYQHTIDTEIETVSFRGSTTYIDTTLDRITITGHGFSTGDQVLYSKDENTNPLPGLIDGTRYWVRKVDDNTIELYDLEANAIAATSITQGRKDFTGVSPDDKLHELTTGNVMVDDNHIYVTNHQFTTGDGVIYRAGKMGAIGGLVDGTAYFVYVESANWFRLASSAANATQKDASGADNPITLPLTSTGFGFQRFEFQDKQLSITSIDTSTNTIATYNGPIFTLASSSISSDFHDYEVGQEVNIYGFQNSAINLGSSTNSAYSISGGLITVQITGVDNSLTSAFFGNMQTLGQAGVTFNFPGADDRFSKTYLIGNWSTGSGTPTLPNNSDLGLGYARYNSSNTTATFVLKQANIDTASDVTTSSGTGVSILDNLADLNGRKYITHRIERADGYSLQFVVRANLSQIGTAINPTGNQTVVGSLNYVLASLRNSPYGFTKINQSDRFRDGAENIKNNQEFIAEEAVAYVKYYYESSLTRGTALTIGGTNFGQVASTVARGITSWSVTGNKATFKIQKGHNLYPSFSQHTPTNASYTPSNGNFVVTVSGHGFSVGDLIKFDAGAIVMSCATDSNQTNHPYPRGGDPAFDRWLKITAKTTNTFTVNVGVSSDTSAHTFVSAGTNSVKKALTSAVTIAGSGNSTVNGTHGISDIYDDREFTVDLTDATANGQSGTGGTFTDNQQPFRTPNSKDQGNKYGDVSELLFANADMIADYAVNKMLAANPSYTIPTGSTACYDDVRDFIQKCVSHNLKWGGNDRVYDQAKFYIDPGFSLTRDRYVEVFNNAKDACILAGRNLPLYRSTYATKLQYYHNATLDTGAGTVRRDAATLIQKNLELIAFESVQRYNIDNPSHNVPGGNQNCIDDVLDLLRTIVYNLAYGGNEQVYDAAQLYTNSPFLDGEETESRAVFQIAKTLARTVAISDSIGTIEGNHGFTQVLDNTNKGTTVEQALIDDFFTIVDTAIANDNMSHATRTVATNPSCANVISAITTFFSTVTTALGSGSTPGNVNITRTVSPGDQQCIDDTMKILRAFQYDLRYGGNSKIVEAANLYISGASGVQHVATEVTYTRAIFAAAKELAIDAIRNNLESGQFSQIPTRSNGSITVDSSAPECANVVSALVTNWGILDNVLSSGNAYGGTVTNPDPLITEQDGNKYSFPLVNTFLDLPVIEASPYIQNSSLISFLGGSGCEIDGAKVATPNVPRPGLKQNAQGATVAQFDPQGKSMVANAFTIICFGGTAYNVSNDGYTQLVSVFAIFCQDGILTQSGGYASVTNSASNFGTYSLRATGFRAEAYTFDIGVIDSITDDLDGNGVATGRQIIQVSGTTLTGVPVEDYIIKIDGYTSTDPAIEHIILETEVVSGAPGSQIVAKITTNRAMDFSDGTNRYQSNSDPAFAAGSLPLSNLLNKTIRFHRPSVTNSSSHTWEYSGSGNTYAALPQNGGVGLGTAFEAAEEKFGQVYTSGTNEFGDFKVGNFVTIFNRTGAISFVGTVSISELSSIKIVGGDITITGFSKDDNLGGTFASDSLLPTQASVRDYISNNLGPYLNQPYSTNAVPSALVQLTSSGKINIDQIPALRPFNITSVGSTAERLAIEDANAGDIAIETTATTFSIPAANVNTSNEQITIASHGVNTGDLLTYTAGSTSITGLSTGVDYYAIKVDDNTIKLATTESNASSNQAIDLQSQGAGTHQLKTQGTAISYILENDLESQFLAFTPNSNFQFTNGDIIVGSSTTARGTVTNYNDGRIFNFVISTAGDSYSGDFALTIGAPDDTVNGVQAVATANVVNGSVTKVTITNNGKGYYTQPTVQAQVSSGTTAVIAAQIEGRLDIAIANNIKFDAGDFILDQSLANDGTGTYSQSGTTITVTDNSHNLSNADLVYLDFTSGGAADGFYTISLINSNQYSVTSASSGTNSGNVSRKRIIDLSRVINTSATNAANWTQLTSTNIDASNIVAGTIDPERLAGKGTANSYTFLRGDSSWEYALQAIRPTTQDALVIGGDLSDSSYIDSITITNGGTNYTNGTYQNIPMGGGNVSISSDNVARATYIVSGGTITSATVTDSGTGYTGDFSVTIPSELGGGTGAILNATKGTINRAFGNIEIDIRKGNNLTSSASVFGNYGVFRFRKDVTNQAVGNQSEGGFIIDNNGSVSIDQGPNSELNADLLDGNEGSYYQDAGNLTQGTLDPARLLNTTYAISISGTADTANLVFNETQSLTSNPSPAQAGTGIGAALRNNSANGLNDGGTTHGIMTYRREATGNASTQLGFTNNNNLWIRGNSGNAAVYSNWYQIWSQNNQGASSGMDSDKMDGKQGLWYQTGYNVGDTRGGINAPIGDMFLPEVLGQDKMVFENFFVNDTGNKFTLYIPDFHCNSGVGGNINNGGTYTIYSDVGATNNIGSIVVDSSGGVQEKTHTTGEIYSLVTGTIAFVGSNTNANIYVFGPNPGTKWTVSSSNKISGGSSTIIGLRDNANGAKLQIGKASVSTTPTIDFRSSGQAPNYDVQMIVSGGNGTDGNGTIRFNASDFTFNGNTVWHAGNDGSTSQLDAHYLDGYVQSTAATGNTIARRDASGHLTVNDLTGDQGIFTNSGAATLSLADSNGITLGKSNTNTLAIQGKQASSNGFIRFGSDSKYFGYNNSYLYYGTSGSNTTMVWRGENVGIGNQANNPSTLLHLNSDSGSTVELRLTASGNGGNADPQIRFTGQNDSTGEGALLHYDNSNGVFTMDQVWTGVPAGNDAIRFRVDAAGTPILGLGIRGDGGVTAHETFRASKQIISSIATGTAPITVSSTTVCTNLNADLLDGYTALSLPYLQGRVNVWISDDGGQERFYFANNAATYFRTGTDYYFRNNSNSGIGSLNDNGCWTFYSGSDRVQSTYGLQVEQLNGINLQATESLSSGQKSTVLRAGGDKLWIDSYGVFRRNRNSVAENISVNNGDNCMSAGPITINNGVTITVNNGGSWSVV